ncbi:AF4/FMR2 family member lilli-like isoform X1 [Cherax quadricarinatus]|nr:AF4/FMR2 family member lilli-like isoform X2 [Cherax quadricarinatus]
MREMSIDCEEECSNIEDIEMVNFTDFELTLRYLFTEFKGDLTRNGAVNHWSYALSEQYQQSYYPQYQYQQYQYHHESYYNQQVYQQQQAYYPQQHQYFSQSSYTAPEPQQQYPVGAQQAGESGQCWECGATFQDVALLRDHLALFHAHVLTYSCRLCPVIFPSQTLLAHHFSSCHVVGDPTASARTQHPVTRQITPLVPQLQTGEAQLPKKETEFVSKGNESCKERQKEDLWCIHCRINQFASEKEFEAHHLGHVRQKTLKVRLRRLTAAELKRAKVEPGRKRRRSSIKLKLKISKVGRGRGRKRREVQIVNNEGMSENHNSFQEQHRLEAEAREPEVADGTEESRVPEEKEESGGDSEGDREASGSPSEQRDTEDQVEQNLPSGHDDLDSGREQDYEQEEQDSQQDDSEQQEQDQEKEEEAASSQQKETQGNYQEASGSADQAENSSGSFNAGFGEQELGFGNAGSSEAPPSTYQPQFESFPTSDWFSEYESGSRIAAAMAGATAAESASESSAWAGGTEGAADPDYSSADTPPEKESSSHPVNGGESEGDGEDGLFSQAVLGQESPEKNDRQGSFEQLCLNDSFSVQSQDSNEEQSQEQQEDQSELSPPQEQQQQQQQQQQASGVASDLLSELEYLNNSGQSSQDSQPDSQPGSQPGSQSGSQSGQVDGSPHSGGPSPHSGGPATPSHLSSRGSNSGTPTSSGGQPTPPPSDTSFRALATSPVTSPTQQSTSPSLHKGPTPPATSPLQQSQQLSPQSGDQQAGVPRLTIANNLMAPATSAHMIATTTASQATVGSMISRYGNQWSQNAAYSAAGSYGALAGTSMANTSIAGPLRAPLPPSVAMPYRPSPPPRVRGRPPLMGHVGRPPLHQAAHLQPSRGPGRPPTSSILPPPLMPAPGGRGGMMPPLQRMHQTMYPGQRQASPQQQSAAGKRQLLGAAGHSPSKSARREDINVPSRQKDNECQIIAVANRSDGLPVISNVQGGSAAPGSQHRGSSGPATTESTINLSDSITLSVRASGGKDASSRGERSGPEAGAVANLLASRGITVTPAAGERQDGTGGRDDRRLPTAQELNLSSAISVHPPTQREREGGGRERDRDGFAVPQAPPTRGVSNSTLERPPRPPTVDLTQDVPSTGSQGTRHKCHQCERSFPTAALLSEHSRVHQQQQQSRMPFKCHLCTAGFSTQKGQQHHYQQFHQLHLSAGDVAIPLVDLRNPVNVQRMAALGIRSFLPLTNLQNRGAGGVVGVPILTLENLRNGHMTLQQWGVSDVLSLGPAKTLNMPR